ncbi:DUF4440 domain-containing protein [Flagellimonas sp. DF-77]|uniref:nuclear transport factor 2 family protein n=1 Tax=Flagellimonas algarum TaxID=3230298 RepID=UPI00339677A8
MKYIMKNRFLFLSSILLFGISCEHRSKENETFFETPPKGGTTQLGVAPDDPLFMAIAKVDSLMFSTAQKDCDLEAYADFLDEDFEFFHDKAGFTPSKEAEMKDMAIFCGEEQRSRQPLRRELTPGTLRVFPMDNYGALEFCDHIFYLQINDGTEKVVGSGRMTAIWKEVEGAWKLARVVSYDHQHLAEIELPDATLDRYVGTYELPDRLVTIEKEAKFLRATDVHDGEPGWNTLLFPESENRFYFNYENVVYEFVGTDGRVETLNIYENGGLIEAAQRKQ